MHNIASQLASSDCRYIAELNGARAEDDMAEGIATVVTVEDLSDPEQIFSQLFVPPLRWVLVRG